MRFVDVGKGEPVIVIPGIQGRWEWMRPGIHALSQRCRVVTYSLADEPSCGGEFDPAAGFACYVEQVRQVMDQAGIERATVCGVSYGGLVAAAFAGRYPNRVCSLVLMSALPPSWAPDRRIRFYLRAPRLLTPVFVMASLRMYREIAAAHPGVWQSLRETMRHGWNVSTHLFSPTRMARRVSLLGSVDFQSIGRVDVPALVITGDAALDRVVPVQATREYLRLLPQARAVTVERTGHLGFITRPAAFAEVVAAFVGETSGRLEARRRIG